MIDTGIAAVCALISGAVEWQCDRDAGRQRIYFGNHSSHLDFVVIWSALPSTLRRFVRPVAGRDYWDQSAIRRYLAKEVFHAVLIDRGLPEQANAVATARASTQRIVDEMGETNSVIVFPEGTRSLNGQVGPFKSGLYHLSRLRPDAELIPVHLENLNRILPKGEALPVPMLSRVVFGRPLAFEVGEGKHEFLERARAALIRLRVT